MVSAIECMEAFYDNEHPFSEFLKTTGALQAAISTGVQLRPIHRIHPKVLDIFAIYCIILIGGDACSVLGSRSKSQTKPSPT